MFASLQYLQFYSILSVQFNPPAHLLTKFSTVYSTALKDIYRLNDIQIGLCYLYVLIKHDMQRSGLIIQACRYRNGHHGAHQRTPNGLPLPQRGETSWRRLPQERRRVQAGAHALLDCHPLHVVRRPSPLCDQPRGDQTDILRSSFFIASICFGWCLQVRTNLAAILVFNFFIGLGSSVISIPTVYGQDLLPSKGGAVSASVSCLHAPNNGSSLTDTAQPRSMLVRRGRHIGHHDLVQCHWRWVDVRAAHRIVHRRATAANSGRSPCSAVACQARGEEAATSGAEGAREVADQ